MEQWWICPKCGKKVNFTNEMFTCFDDKDGEAIFAPEGGIFFHTIMCDCGAYWIMSLSPMYDNEKEKESRGEIL